MIHERDSQDSAAHPTHGSDLLQWKDTKHSQQREEQVGEVWGKPGTSIYGSSPSGVPKDTLGSLIKQRILHVRRQPDLLGDSVPKVFDCARRQPLPGTSPNSRLSKGKRGLSINHVVCINSLDTASRSYQLRVGTFLKSMFPDTSQGPTLQADLSLYSSLGLCIGFTWFQTHFFFFWSKTEVVLIQEWSCLHWGSCVLMS